MTAHPKDRLPYPTGVPGPIPSHDTAGPSLLDSAERHLAWATRKLDDARSYHQVGQVGAAILLAVGSGFLIAVLVGWHDGVLPMVVCTFLGALAEVEAILARDKVRQAEAVVRQERGKVERRHVAMLEAELGLPILRDGDCPQCATKLVVGQPHCPGCGVDVADFLAKKERRALERVICVNCGARQPDDAKFCPGCGKLPSAAARAVEDISGEDLVFAPQPTSATRRPKGEDTIDWTMTIGKPSAFPVELGCPEGGYHDWELETRDGSTHRKCTKCHSRRPLQGAYAQPPVPPPPGFWNGLAATDPAKVFSPGQIASGVQPPFARPSAKEVKAQHQKLVQAANNVSSLTSRSDLEHAIKALETIGRASNWSSITVTTDEKTIQRVVRMTPEESQAEWEHLHGTKERPR